MQLQRARLASMAALSAFVASAAAWGHIDMRGYHPDAGYRSNHGGHYRGPSHSPGLAVRRARKRDERHRRHAAQRRLRVAA